MKNLHSLLFILGLTSTLTFNSQAQSAVFDEAVTVAAQSICDCANETFNMDKDVENAFIQMLELDDENEVSTYLAGLSEDVQLGVMEAAVNMQSMEEDDGFNQCITGIEKDLEPYQDRLKDASYTEADFQNGIITKLSGSQDCKLTYLLVQLSLQMGDTDEIVDNDDNYDPNSKGGGENHQKKKLKNSNENNDPRYGGGGNSDD
ncbi:MAG: hypothetical protein GY810_19520 [Aureispira sp.]|nr:hypothetical protein [Aureispira sp.]